MHPGTKILKGLLQEYPRQAIGKCLQHIDYQVEQVVDGTLRALLADQHDIKLETKSGASFRAGYAEDKQSIGFFDSSYPAVLRHVPDPPLVLYYRGDLSVLGKPSIAVVGARRATKMGRVTAHQLGAGFVDAGLVVVSGLAYGIDIAAHQGALSSQNTSQGRCVAVLGGGLDEIYPRRHTAVARAIVASGGLLLSEYPGHYPPLPHQFPERNRIISGLSNGVVVVEAGLRSGSLITARLALEQGRDVFAFPGLISSSVSRGCHALIRQGAELVTDADQVLDSIGWQPVDGGSDHETLRGAVDLDQDQTYIFALLQQAPMTVDALLHTTGWPVEKIFSVIATLQLIGIVHDSAQGYIASPS